MDTPRWEPGTVVKVLCQRWQETKAAHSRDRLEDPAGRPPGTRPVETLLLSYPIESPAGGGGPVPHAPGPGGHLIPDEPS